MQPAIDYSGRADLIGSMQPLLKSARRPLAPEFERFGVGQDGWNQINVLTDRLERHYYFEHLGRKKICDALREGVQRYRTTPPASRLPGKDFAAEILDGMAEKPLRRTLYLGVEHLKLPDGTVVGEVRFLDPSNDPELVEAFSLFGQSAPRLVCEVEAIAGTDVLLRERARSKAEVALGLIRQHNLFGFNGKIYLDQVVYGLDGRYTWRNGETTAQAGWWRHKPSPSPMDLAHPNGNQWRTELAELSGLYMGLAPDLRLRLDTCIDWLDVAALTDRWRIMIPAIFSGMEALLVPGTVGLKAEVVTVRSVGVHVAVGNGFFDPGQILSAYDLRSALIHGKPTPEIIDTEATDFADLRRRWAFRVLKDYLELAKSVGATSVSDIISRLDEHECHEVCAWLTQHNGSRVVTEYRKVVPDRPANPEGTSPAT